MEFELAPDFNPFADPASAPEPAPKPASNTAASDTAASDTAASDTAPPPAFELAPEGETLLKPVIPPLKVAILGASGIGRSHARWFARHGCQIVSILGSTEESVAETGSQLVSDFDFSGFTYTDLSALLRETTPDAVCIATPSALHFAQAIECLEAGAHVLCEKPLVYAPERKRRENIDGAKELVRLARKKGLILATQLQYGAATPILCKLAGNSPQRVGDLAIELETTNANAPREARELWIDLGSHAVSMAQYLGGEKAALNEDSVRFQANQTEESTEVRARFSLQCEGERLLTCRVVLRVFDASSNKTPSRRFAFDGLVVTYRGHQGSDGIYRAQFTAPDGYDSAYDDPVNYLIGDFIRSIRKKKDPLTSGEFGMRNLELLLKIVEHFDKSSSPAA